MQQLPPHNFAGSAFEEHFVRNNHRGFAVDVEQRFDVLDEVELLFARRSLEVLAHNGGGLSLHFPFFGNIGDTALFAKWRVGKHDIEAFAIISSQAIINMDGTHPPIRANPMQVKVHYAQTGGIIYDLQTIRSGEYDTFPSFSPRIIL